MKSLLITLMVLASAASLSAENRKCELQATTYAIDYVIKSYDLNPNDIVLKAVHGNETPGVDGFIALGVNLVLPDGQELTVIPMMTQGCRLVDIMAF